MPKSVVQFRIVVASPREVSDAREAAFSALRELDRVLDSQGISIKAVGWEEYAIPGIADDSQDVISGQIMTDHDILIGIFGTKLGSPTLQHRSGTIAEIEQCIQNNDHPLGKNRIHLYFRDKIENLSDVSSEDLIDLIKFKESIQNRGVFYRTFKDNNDIEKSIRVNVQKAIMEYIANNKSSTSMSNELAPVIENAESIIESGILDLQEQFEIGLTGATSIFGQIGDTVTEISLELKKRSSELDSVNYKDMAAAQKKRLVNEIADFLSVKGKLLSRLSADATSMFEGALNAFAESVDIGRKEFNNEFIIEDELKFTIISSQSSIEEARIGNIRFYEAIKSLPRITADFNRAKRDLIEGVEGCIIMLDKAGQGIKLVLDQIELSTSA